LAFQVYQSIASEIYLDEKLLQRYGKVSSDNRKVLAFQPLDEPAGIEFKKQDHLLAVRFSVKNDIPYRKYRDAYVAFSMNINKVERAVNYYQSQNKGRLYNALYAGIFIVLTIIHLGLFLAYSKQKANLFFSVATFSAAVAHALFIFITFTRNIALRSYLVIIDWILLSTLFNLFLFIAIHFLFLRKRNFYFWSIIFYSIASLALWNSNKSSELWAFMLPFLVTMIASIKIAWGAYRNGNRDASIIVVGIFSYLILNSFFWLMYHGFISNRDIGFGYDFSLIEAVYQISVLTVPFALSLYLSRDFAFTSKQLENKLSEVQALHAKMIDQEQEKQQILASQNETLEQQVKERTSALSQSLEDLKKTQSQLIQSEKMASLGELTAGIAHEIQNPLNFVNNFSEVNRELLSEMKEEIQKGNFEQVKIIAAGIEENEQKIMHHGKRADAIVKGMLQHSRKNTGTKEPTDINSLVDEYLQLSYHGLRAKDKSFNVSIQTDFDPSIGNVDFVPQEIGRVLLNLYNNAFYAVGEKRKQENGLYKPTVLVTTRRTRDMVEIIVKDNGPGIPETVRDKVFQPFFTTKPSGQGTGLGLSMSYDIVKTHGGELNVKTKEGEFTELIIKLPMISSESESTSKS
jgi:signal transduction histidine kinase